MLPEEGGGTVMHRSNSDASVIPSHTNTHLLPLSWKTTPSAPRSQHGCHVFFVFFLVEDLPQWSSSGLHDLTRTKRCNRYRPRGRTLADIAEVCFSDTFGIRSPHLRDNWISKHLASHIRRLHCNWFHWVLFAFPITSVASGPF